MFIHESSHVGELATLGTPTWAENLQRSLPSFRLMIIHKF